MPATGAGVYAVLASNPVGRTRSAGARISVVKRVRIVTQPRSKILKAWATASFSVRVSGGAPITYQWMREGAPLPGATRRLWSLRNVSPSDAGSYWVVVIPFLIKLR